MRAGSLRHIVKIQQPTTTKQSGVAVTEWSDFATGIRASIEQLRPYDKAALAETMPGADYIIIMRYHAGITGNMRVMDESGTIYSILGAPNDVEGRHRELVLTCQSGVKAA